jgi:tRNA threonylcarbamoyladenosine biosynthesis protein TsaB
MLLALDTSTRQTGIALYDGTRGLLAEHHWYSANQHTRELMPEAAQIMRQVGVGADGLTAVAVALGPGSFTGLRVALAAAKGLALARGLPLIGVPTLDVAAYPHGRQPLPVVALVQAGRGRVCWARYEHGPAGLTAATPYAVSAVTEMADQIEGTVLFAGEILASTRATLAERLGARGQLLPPALAARRAGYLAEIAWGRFAAGDTDDVASLSPIYLHEPAPAAGAKAH